MISGPYAPDDDPLGAVVESFLARFRRGERPSLTELIARYPDLAGEIHELIPALVKLEQLGGSTGGAGDRPGSNGPGVNGAAPERLGDYVILRPIGGGGMGVVYEAEHESLKSRVALKVVHPRFRTDPKYLKRFHAEARVAAGLHHTNIVSVFDFGDHDGVCYYAMQYIEGQPLDHVLTDIRRLRDEGTNDGFVLNPGANLTLEIASVRARSSAAVQGLLTGRFASAVAADLAGATDPTVVLRDATPAQRPGPADTAAEHSSTLGSSSLSDLTDLRYFREIARVGAQVADALEYAHRRGVLHRDIKPSNLLLDALGNVWVTDFGLAKLEEGDDLSQSRELVGTLRYMAPERFRGVSSRRGDLYSLGATLYELLTLRSAFEGSDALRLIELIRTESPAPLRHLGRSIPRDLETIVMKSLAKDPNDRFGSARELADELRRFVEGRPIRSRPVSVVEQLWRWCKRDPWLAGATCAAALLAIVLSTVSSVAAIVYWNQTRALSTERRRSDAAALVAQWRAVDAYSAQARAERFSHRPGQRFASLKAVADAAQLLDGLPAGPENALRRDTLRDLAIASMALPDVELDGRVFSRPQGVVAFAFDPTMTRYALRFRGGTVSVRRVADDHEIASLQAQGDRDLWIFYFSPDGRYLAASQSPSHGLIVWDVDKRLIAAADPGPIPVLARFSPDSRTIVLQRGGEIRVYDLTSGQTIKPWPGFAEALAVSPDGTQIACIDNNAKQASCRILDAETGRTVREFPPGGAAADVAWSPDGTTLAIPVGERKINLYDVATGTPRLSLEVDHRGGLRVAFHPAGTLIASQDWSGQNRFWDTSLGRPVLSLANTGGRLAFSRDRQIVIALDDRISSYKVNPALEYRTFIHSSDGPVNYYDASVRHDGRLLAVGTNKGAALWDLAHGTEIAFLPIGNAWHLTFDRAGDLITSGSMGVRRWPIVLDADRGACRVGPPAPLRLPAGLCGFAVDGSGQILAKADHSYACVATPLKTGRVGPLNDCRSVDISPDGKWLATGTHVEGHGVQVWRISDLNKVVELPIDYGTGALFSPDGRWLMTGASPCRLWEVGTWREVRRIGGAGSCFSPDSRLIAVQEMNGVIRLVETDTGRTLARLESPELCRVAMTFSPDGAQLVATTNDGPSIHVWDLRAIRKRLAAMGLDWNAPAYSLDQPIGSSVPPFRQVEIRDFERAIARGAALASEGQWDKAAAVYTAAFAYGTSDSPLCWFERATLCLAAGDAAGYRLTCESMLDIYQRGKRQDWLEFAAHALVLAPAGKAEIDQALRLAQERAAVYPDAFSEHVLGLALYRAGRFEEIERRLQRNDARNPAWRGVILDRLVVAMAQYKLGRDDEARRSLNDVESWVSARVRDRPGGADRALPRKLALARRNHLGAAASRSTLIDRT